MYQKERRVTIDKYGTISVSGNKSHIPIGRCYKGSRRIVGRILKPDEVWANVCTPENSLYFDLSTIKQVREYATQIHVNLLTS
jgi:hypothetical protein